MRRILRILRLIWWLRVILLCMVWRCAPRRSSRIIIVSAIIVICAADVDPCGFKVFARMARAAVPKTGPILEVAANLATTCWAFRRCLGGALPVESAFARAVVKLAEDFWLEELGGPPEQLWLREALVQEREEDRAIEAEVPSE